MRLNTGQYTALLWDVAHNKKGKELERVMERFVETVQSRRDGALLRDILHSFDKLVQKKHEEHAFHITASHMVPHELIEGLRKKMNVPEDAATIEHKNGMESGGVIARHGDIVLDASVHTLLTKWKQQLTTE